MQNTPERKEQPRRKQIAFDLRENSLKKFYPRPRKQVSDRYHKKAWTDVASFMIANGFEHRQYSVYNSKDELMEMDVYAVVKLMARNMPWTKKCLEVMDMTDIGENQDLIPFLEDEEQQDQIAE